MTRQTQRSLASRIHRTLFWRLAAAALVLAIGLGLAVWFYERSRVSEAALEQGRRGAGRFLARYVHLFDDPNHLDGTAIAAAFREYAAGRDPSAAGRYVYLAVFSTGGPGHRRIRSPRRHPRASVARPRHCAGAGAGR